jgi:crotonobetainyl-CoA:carnitine CoA-transferase CaiB-like acyl-CoA transferase
MLKAWIGSVTMDEALAALADAEVVASKFYTMDDIVHDETYREREDVITIDDQDFGPVRMQGVIPKLSQHPGKIWRTGPSIGEDNEFVYKKMLGMTDDEIERLHADGVILQPTTASTRDIGSFLALDDSIF